MCPFILRFGEFSLHHWHLCSHVLSYRNCVASLAVVIALKGSMASWPKSVHFGFAFEIFHVFLFWSSQGTWQLKRLSKTVMFSLTRWEWQKLKKNCAEENIYINTFFWTLNCTQVESPNKEARCGAKQEKQNNHSNDVVTKIAPRSQRSQVELRLPWLAKRFRGSAECPGWNTEVFFPLFCFWACWIETILTIGPIFTQIAWAMFAYLQKSVRRLVNCHQSRNGPGPTRLFCFVFFFPLKSR